MFRNCSALLLPVALTLAMAGSAEAGLVKWFEKEVIPTVKGERELKIRNGVKISHKGNVLEVGEDSAKIVFGDVTIKTHQLKKRLLQLGCTIETGGNVVGCAPDVVEREIENFVGKAIEEQEQAGQRRREGNSRLIDYARKRDAEWHDPAARRSEETVDARTGWKLVEFKAPVGSVQLVAKSWNAGRAERYYDGYAETDLLVYVEGLGFTRLDSSLEFPFAVSRLWLKINDEYVFDNSGTARVRFDELPTQAWHTPGSSSADSPPAQPAAGEYETWLGVSVYDANSAYMRGKGFSFGSGVVVAGLEPNSPAKRSGLADNDVILAVNHIAVADTGRFAALIQSLPGGTPVPFRVWREGRIIEELPVTIGLKLKSQL